MARFFGEALRAARKSASLTQEQLARKVRSHPKHIGFLEQGRRNPSPEQVAALARALDIEPWRLLQGYVQDAQERASTAGEMTLAVVGFNALAASMSSDEWNALRSRPRLAAERIQSWNIRVSSERSPGSEPPTKKRLRITRA